MFLKRIFGKSFNKYKNVQKEKFYESVQAYVDSGMLRKVAAFDHCVLYAFFEMVYLLCP